MSIEITKLIDATGASRNNYQVDSWVLWGNGDITTAPSENGGPVTTDGAGKLDIPTNAVGGILMLRTSDTEMQLLHVDDLKT